ncbi:unnamed protein product [Ambrosiozyma monospora]|uniref:Unnamed protein product n=1 Tax=Ambrosiozyma monospora TaxID=43982 RepID=A0ACB5T1X0_AMBMO|nr:unnamed protein product [Ambrosiozyma monospora]
MEEEDYADIKREDDNDEDIAYLADPSHDLEYNNDDSDIEILPSPEFPVTLYYSPKSSKKISDYDSKAASVLNSYSSTETERLTGWRANRIKHLNDLARDKINVDIPENDYSLDMDEHTTAKVFIPKLKKFLDDHKISGNEEIDPSIHRAYRLIFMMKGEVYSFTTSQLLQFLRVYRHVMPFNKTGDSGYALFCRCSPNAFGQKHCQRCFFRVTMWYDYMRDCFYMKRTGELVPHSHDISVSAIKCDVDPSVFGPGGVADIIDYSPPVQYEEISDESDSSEVQETFVGQDQIDQRHEAAANGQQKGVSPMNSPHTNPTSNNVTRRSSKSYNTQRPSSFSSPASQTQTQLQQQQQQQHYRLQQQLEQQYQMQQMQQQLQQLEPPS